MVKDTFMSGRIMSIVLIVTMIVSQFACTIRRPQKITVEEFLRDPPRDEKPQTGVHGITSVDERDKILAVVLRTLEHIEFDKAGGKYVAQERVIRGTTKKGHEVTISMDEVTHVKVESVAGGESLIATIALVFGVIIAIGIVLGFAGYEGEGDWVW